MENKKKIVVVENKIQLYIPLQLSEQGRKNGEKTITFSYIFIAGVFDALTKRSTK